MASNYPTGIDVFDDFRDYNPDGFSVIESITVPSTSPYVVYLDYLPKYNPDQDISISGFNRVVYESDLSNNRFHCDFRRGILTFYSGNAGEDLTVSYTGLGTFWKKEYVDSLVDAVTAIETDLTEVQAYHNTGLDINIRKGRVVIENIVYEYSSETTLTLTASNTNYVYVDENGVLSANITGFPENCIPLAEVTANASTVTAIADKRCRLGIAGSGNGGGETCIALAPEYSGAVEYSDTSLDGGTLSLGHDSTAFFNYYNFIGVTGGAETQSKQIIIRFRLPENFEDLRDIKIWSKGETGTFLAVQLFDTQNNEISLVGSTGINNPSWAENTITLE